MKKQLLWRWTLFAGFFHACMVCTGATLPSGFVELQIAQNLDPTAMALTPDGRLFITEKNGRVLIVQGGKLLQDPFVVLDVDNYNERGLSGIAIHPNFAENGYVYLYYTVKGENHNRVSRFVADGNLALPGSEEIILDIDELNGTIHNAGAMAFDPQGKLFICIGDGANGVAPQELNSLLGKILRINDDGSIPEDNPFYTMTTGKYRAIYALGVRNPFSMSIQPGTGRIFATDVGSAFWEEVNEILPGRNYGWITVEGPLNNQTPPDNYMDPAYTYNHNLGCAAVGATFYNPDDLIFPSKYHGKFFFADYCHGYIKYLDPDAPNATTTFATNINRPLSLLTAPDGTLYYLARAGIGGGSDEDNTASTNGTLWRIIYTGTGLPFVSVNPQTVLVSEGEDASFATAASGQQPLMYQWQMNGEDIAGANAATYTYLNATLSDSGSVFRCIVSNINGSDTTLEAQLLVTSNQRPEPEILMPETNTMYRAGQTIHFAGRGIDPEQGELSPDNLRWKIDFHHEQHTHPGLAPTSGISEGDFYIPQTGETSDDVWYQINLTVTDDNGLSKTVSRDVYPLKTQINIESVPTAIPVHIESNYVQTPFSTSSVVGVARRIEVQPILYDGDSLWVFREWSSGETTPAITFAASEDTVTYTAFFDKYSMGDGTGIRGYYYDGFEFDATFYEPYKFTWIDTTIDFEWGEGSPAESQLGNDFFLVRWEGYIEPIFSDTYQFHVIADDGLRLWVNDELLIDAWIPQPPTEWIGSIALDGGKQYPIKLEYFEEAGGATCRLFWSSDRLSRTVVQRSQLFPERSSGTDPSNSLPVRIYPNPARDQLIVHPEEELKGSMHIEIYNALGQRMLLLNDIVAEEDIMVDVHALANGFYWLSCQAASGRRALFTFVKE